MRNWTKELLQKFSVRSSFDGTPDEKAAADKLVADKKIADDKIIADKIAADKLVADKDKDKKDKLDVSSLSDDAQKLIKDLRAENAKHRTSNNNITTKMERLEAGLKKMLGDEGDDVDPEKKLDALQGSYESMATRNAILELAVSNGVSGVENVEYFEFLMNKKLSSLEEGEELDDESLEAIVAKCAGTQEKANTSTGDGGKGGGGKPKVEGETTQEEFDKMGMMAKTKLFQTNRPLYDKLMAGSTV